MSRNSHDLPAQSGQLDLFRALPGDMAPRDAQDLMAHPFFSLAKSRRTVPIDFRSGEVTVRVEGTLEHGIATIWDADILIWAASQLVEARDAGIPTSRLMRATPYQILRFIGRGTSLRDYQRLKAALDRLQSTSVATSIRETTGRRLHRFSWINEWKELAASDGRPLGIELILPDWFYSGVLDQALVLTIDPAYFRLTGGIERWLYRLVRKHGGKQKDGWQFDFRHLYRKSGSSRAIRTLLWMCVLWSPGSHFQGIAWRSFTCPHRPSCSPSGACRRRHGDNLRKSCECSRAIRRNRARAIRRILIVLSGARTPLQATTGGPFSSP